MPRVISDDLYESLISHIGEGRLLGVMGKLERLRDGAVNVEKVETLQCNWCQGRYDYKLIWEDAEGETKTNNN